MISPTRLLIALLALTLLPLCPADPAADTYSRAASLLRQGKPKECLTLLENLHATGHHAPQSWLLDGNAHAVLDDAPAAILAYRRALLLDPTLTEARQNLQVLTRRESIPEAPPAQPAIRMLTSLPPGTLWLAGSLGLWLLLGGLACRLVFQLSSLWLVAAPVALGATLLPLALAAHLYIHGLPNADTPASSRNWQANAQISRPLPLRAQPARNSASVLNSIPAGTSAKILTDAGWAYAEIPTGPNSPPVRGWLEPGSWLALWPFDPGLLHQRLPGPR